MCMRVRIHTHPLPGLIHTQRVEGHGVALGLVDVERRSGDARLLMHLYICIHVQVMQGSSCTYVHIYIYMYM